MQGIANCAWTSLKDANCALTPALVLIVSMAIIWMQLNAISVDPISLGVRFVPRGQSAPIANLATIWMGTPANSVKYP